MSRIGPTKQGRERNPPAVCESSQRRTSQEKDVDEERGAEMLDDSWAFLPHKSAALDLEYPDPDHHACAPLIHDSRVHDLSVCGGAVENPAACGRVSLDPLAGAGLRPGLMAGRDTGYPDAALAGLREMPGRDAQRR